MTEKEFNLSEKKFRERLKKLKIPEFEYNEIRIPARN